MSFPPLTQAQFIQLWRTLFPEGYTHPIESEAFEQGLDVYAMQAAMFARVDAAANETFGRLYIRLHSTQTSDPASGAARATTTLSLVRAAPATHAFTFARGVTYLATLRTPTGETIDGVRFRVVSDTTIGSGSLSGTVDVEAQRVGYVYNVPAGSITGFAPVGSASIPSAMVTAANTLADRGGLFGGDRLTLAMVNQYVRLVGGANDGQIRRIVSVTQPTDTNPIASAVLDGAALTFPVTLTRAEVLEFSDLGFSVSQPNDATGGLDGWLDSLGAERLVFRQAGESDEAYRARIETLPDVVSPGAMLRAASRVLSPLGIPWRLQETRDPFGLRGFVCDVDPCDEGTIVDGMLPLSYVEMVRFFVMVVGLGAQGEYGMFCDTYTRPTLDACDVGGACDGRPVIYDSTIAQLWASLNSRRGAGIRFAIERSVLL